MMRRILRLAGSFTTAAPLIIAAGCAVPTSLSPTAQLLDQAAHAVQLAESEEAVRYAPDEFLASKTALTEATTAQSESGHSSDFGFKQRRDQNARIAAYRAWQQAELASAKTRAAKARDSITALKSETARYQADTQRFQAEEEAARQQRAKEVAEAARNRAMAKAEVETAAKERALREKAQAELFAAREAAEKERALQRSQELERAKQELEAKLKDALKEIAQVREENRGLIISLSDIHFDFGKATLLPNTQHKLAQLAKILSTYADRKILVEGHTDNVGGDAFNLQLSEARAESVRNALIDNGVSSDMISAAGFGMTKPVASNDTSAGRQQNRRVEVVVLNPPPAAPSGEPAPSAETKAAPTAPATPAPPAPDAPPAPQAPAAP
jgi:outer membrane protein OmpA-like peptidoglycan-associated protein